MRCCRRLLNPGQQIDVTVSSVGNAKSLRGGTLLLTPLKAVNGEVFALAQGDLVVGGFGAEGADGSKVTVNIPSVGRIPNGASVERPAPSNFGAQRYADVQSQSRRFHDRAARCRQHQSDLRA